MVFGGKYSGRGGTRTPLAIQGETRDAAHGCAYFLCGGVSDGLGELVEAWPLLSQRPPIDHDDRSRVR